MSFSQEELDKLKGLLKEIIAEDYFDVLHESKKKLLISQQKQQRLKEILDKDLAARQVFEKCHECHKSMIVCHDAQTQTIDQDLLDETLTMPEDKPGHNESVASIPIQAEPTKSDRNPGSHLSNDIINSPNMTITKREVNPTPQKSTIEQEVICIDSD